MPRPDVGGRDQTPRRPNRKSAGHYLTVENPRHRIMAIPRWSIVGTAGSRGSPWGLTFSGRLLDEPEGDQAQTDPSGPVQGADTQALGQMHRQRVARPTLIARGPGDSHGARTRPTASVGNVRNGRSTPGGKTCLPSLLAVAIGPSFPIPTKTLLWRQGIAFPGDHLDRGGRVGVSPEAEDCEPPLDPH